MLGTPVRHLDRNGRRSPGRQLEDVVEEGTDAGRCAVASRQVFMPLLYLRRVDR